MGFFIFVLNSCRLVEKLRGVGPGLGGYFSSNRSCCNCTLVSFYVNFRWRFSTSGDPLTIVTQGNCNR